MTQQRKWTRKTIRQMQGLADDIRSGGTPPIHPHEWLTANTGLGEAAIRNLRRGRDSGGRRPEVKAQRLHQDFVAAYEALAQACARPYVAVVGEIALNDNNTPSDRMKAAVWTAEVVFPERYGKQTNRVEVAIDTPGEPQASDIDPAVWDEMNEDEEQRLTALLEQRETIEKARDEIIAGVKKRVDALDSW